MAEERTLDFQHPVIDVNDCWIDKKTKKKVCKGIATGNVLKAIFDYYFHTDPETGYFIPDASFVYPNNCTPKKLNALFEWLASLHRIVEKNSLNTANHAWFGAKIGPGGGAAGGESERLYREYVRWAERQSFYFDVHNALYALEDAGETIMLGMPDSPASRRLGTYLVEPLFLGWYPNTEATLQSGTWPSKWGVGEPFSHQGIPYESQLVQAPPDLNTPFSLLNQSQITEVAYENAKKQFSKDLGQGLIDLAPDPPKGMGTFVAVAAIAAAAMYGFTLGGPPRPKV